MSYTIDNFDTEERVVITKEKLVKEKLPPYNLVGNGLANRHGTSLDLIDVCVQLNLSELRLLQYLRNMFNNNCIHKEVTPNIIEPTKGDDWNDYLKVALKKNYKHMEYLKLITRISRGKYMLNPYLFMYSKGYNKTATIWNELLDAKGLDNDEI